MPERRVVFAFFQPLISHRRDRCHRVEDDVDEQRTLPDLGDPAFVIYFVWYPRSWQQASSLG
jgi:hypothetical protein